MKAKEKAEELKAKVKGPYLCGLDLLQVRIAYLDRMMELVKLRKPQSWAGIDAIHREVSDWARKVAQYMGFDDNQVEKLKRLTDKKHQEAKEKFKI